MRAKLRAAWPLLTPQQRETFRLLRTALRLHPKSKAYAAAAALGNLNYGTFWARLQRAKLAVREILALHSGQADASLTTDPDTAPSFDVAA